MLRFLAAILTVCLTIQTVPAAAVEELLETDPLTQAALEEVPMPEDTEPEIIGEDTTLREENVKHFKMSDGSYTAVEYYGAVHFLNEQKEYEEIDNSLTATSLDGKNYYKNANNSFDVYLPQTLTDDVVIRQNGRSLSWTLQPSQSLSARAAQTGSRATVQISNQVDLDNAAFQQQQALTEEPLEQIKLSNEQKRTVSKAKSSAVYANAYQGIDVTYDLAGNALKESIILNQPTGQKQFQFQMDTDGYTARLNADLSVDFLDASTNQAVFRMAAPYMFDANGATSEDIQVSLTETQDGYQYTIQPSQVWLNSKDRTYPVTIDPTIMPVYTAKNIKDTTASFTTKANSNYSRLDSERDSLKVGKRGNAELVALLYVDMPSSIPDTARILDATMSLCYYRYAYTTCSTDLQLNVHAITSDWNQTIINENIPLCTDTSPATPSYTEGAIDYIIVNDGSTSAHGVWHTFNITEYVQGWMEGQTNRGIMIKAASLPSSEKFARFFDSDSAVTNSDPAFVFSYRDTTGVEDYWSYHSQDVGRAGAGYVNDFNGNLTFIAPDVSTVGELPTVSVSHVYNSNNTNDSRIGRGWRLNVMQQVVQETISQANGDSTFYAYIDGEGTKHYFYNDNGTYRDEDGLGMVLTFINEGEFRYQIVTKDNHTLKFDLWSYLRRDYYPDGNCISYNYSPDVSDIYLTSIWDANGNHLYLEYTADKRRLASIYNPATEQRIYYYYLGSTYDTFHKMVHEDGTNVYNYTDARLSQAQSYDGYQINYQYSTNGKFSRVTKISEASVAQDTTTAGRSMSISYDKLNTTVFTDSGLDGNLSTTADNNVVTYQFDHYGHPVSVYKDDGTASTMAYQGDTVTKQHQLRASAQTQTYINNMLLDTTMYPAPASSNWRREGSGSITQNTADGLMDTKSYQMSRTSAGPSYIQQQIKLNRGTYTFSIYAKTTDVTPGTGKGGVFIGAPQFTGENEQGLIKNEGMTVLTGTTDRSVNNGWSRLQLTFTVAADNTYVMVRAGLQNASGTVLLDCAQLEQGDTANKFNLIQNSSFANGNNWVVESHITYSGVAGGAYIAAPSTSQRAIVRQDVYASGKAGDVFVLSGSGKAGSVNRADSEFDISVKMIHTDGSTKWYKQSFNKAVQGWQYTSIAIPATKDYSSIQVYLTYSKQLNYAWFTKLQLVKDDGATYAYDSNGNVSSVKTIAEEQNFQYDGSSRLVQSTDTTGSGFTYNYNDKSQLTSAKNSAGVSYRYDYDSHGNATSAQTYSTEDAAPAVGGTYCLRQKLSGKYLTISSDGDSASQQPYTESETGQAWRLKLCSDGLFMLESSAEGHAVLTVQSDLSLTAAPNDGSLSQKFELVKKSGGAYQLIPAANDKANALANASSSTAAGAAITAQSKSENANQCWYFEQADVSDEIVNGGVYRIRLRHSGQYVNAASDGTVTQSYRADSDSQLFTIKQSGDNYKIYLYADPSKYLHTSYNYVYASNSWTIDTDFVFLENPNGTVRIAQSNYQFAPLGFTTESYTDGERLYMDNYHEAAYQQFILERCDTSQSSAVFNDTGTRLLSTTDTRGTTVNYTYDANNRLVAAETIGEHTTNYSYDASDRVTSVSSGESGVTYEYVLGRLDKILHNGTYYKINYDGFGNQLSTYVGTQLLSSNNYGPNNGLLQTTSYATGDTVSFGYDKEYNLTSKSYGNATAVTYRYDASGNLVELNDLAAGVIYTYHYDSINRLTDITGSNGIGYYLSYDGSNRISKVTTQIYGRTDQNGYNYNSDSYIESVQLNGDKTIQYTFDNLLRKNSRTLMTDTPFTTTYQFADGAEGTTSPLVASIQNGSETLGYTYDLYGNITSISKNGVLAESYEYDALNQLTKVTGANGDVYEYAYDNGGNLTSVMFNGTVIKTYGYTDANWTDKLTAFNGQAISYDAIGNPLAYRDGFGFSWQNGRQLASVTQNGAPVASYTYDADGYRTSKTVGGATTEYQWMNGVLLGQKTGDDTLVYLYDEAGTPYALVYNGAAYYYVYNAQLDVIGLLDSTGAWVVHYEYGPWGELLAVTDAAGNDLSQNAGHIANINPLRYRGYTYDAETGFYYLLSRYYDPQTGRYLNADGFVSTGQGILGHNMFAYCGNNPVNRSDPSGQSWLGNLIKGVLAGVSAVIGAQKIISYQPSTATVTYDYKTDRLPAISPISYQSGSYKTKSPKQEDSMIKMNSIYRVDNLWLSSSEIQFKINDFHNTLNFSVDNIGFYSSHTEDKVTNTWGLRLNLLEFKLGLEYQNTVQWDENTTYTTYHNVSINGWAIVALVASIYAGSVINGPSTSPVYS